MARSPGYEVLAAELKQGNVAPAYLLWGEEAFLVARAVREITAAVLGADDPTLGLIRWDTESGSLADAVRDAQELSLLGRRVVLFEGLTSRDAWGYAKLHAKKAERERLEAYVRDPNPSSVLILTGSVADYAQKGLLALAPHLRIFHLGTPDAERLARWAVGKAKALGVELSPRAVTTLVGLSSGSMLQLSNEIEKLALYLEPGAVASSEDVLALTEGSAEESVFEISDAIERGAGAAALQTLRRVAASQSDGEARVIGELRRSFALWFRIRERLERGQAPDQIARALRIVPYVLQRNLPGARLFGCETLVAFLARVRDIERASKSGGRAALPLELLVLDAARAASFGRVGQPAV